MTDSIWLGKRSDSRRQRVPPSTYISRLTDASKRKAAITTAGSASRSSACSGAPAPQQHRTDGDSRFDGYLPCLAGRPRWSPASGARLSSPRSTPSVPSPMSPSSAMAKRPCSGRGLVLVRPRQVRLAPAAAEGTVRAEVVRCRFRGHDHRIEVAPDPRHGLPDRLIAYADNRTPRRRHLPHRDSGCGTSPGIDRGNGPRPSLILRSIVVFWHGPPGC